MTDKTLLSGVAHWTGEAIVACRQATPSELSLDDRFCGPLCTPARSDLCGVSGRRRHIGSAMTALEAGR